VHEQLAEPPTLEFGALGLERLGQVLRHQGVARDQPRAELRTLPGHRNGIDQAALEIDQGFVAVVVHDMQTTGRLFGGEVGKHGLDGSGRQVAFEHGRPPTSYRRLSRASASRPSGSGCVLKSLSGCHRQLRREH